MHTKIIDLLELAGACTLNWNEAGCIDWSEAKALSRACAATTHDAADKTNLLKVLQDVAEQSAGERWESSEVMRWPIMILEAGESVRSTNETSNGNSVCPIRKFRIAVTLLSSESEEEVVVLWLRATNTNEAQKLAEKWSRLEISVENECFAVKPPSASDVSCRYEGDTVEINFSEVGEVTDHLWTMDLSYDVYAGPNTPCLDEQVCFGSFDADSESEFVNFISESMSLEEFELNEAEDHRQSLYFDWGGITVRASLIFNDSENLDLKSEEYLKEEMINRIHKALIVKCRKENELTTTSKVQEEVKALKSSSDNVSLDLVFEAARDIAADLDAKECSYISFKATKMEAMANAARQSVDKLLEMSPFHAIKATFYDDYDGSSVQVEVQPTSGESYGPHEDIESIELSEELIDLESLLEDLQRHLSWNGFVIESIKAGEDSDFKTYHLKGEGMYSGDGWPICPY